MNTNERDEHDDVIEVTDLRRVYGGSRGAGGVFEAVRGVTFSVGRGELFALLGTNGAGKTSTVELLEGLAPPAGGRVRVLGRDPYAEWAAVRPRIGVMLQEGGFPSELTVAETVRMWAGCTSGARRAAEALDLVGLTRGPRYGSSELAVQLARRGRPEAVDQMTEVQRIARESQQEVREVVRGYREADLGTELVGAQGVLTAAGIDCEVNGSAAGLPVQVQSALGWVVREATTNVLRHGDAGRCAVSLRVTEGRAVLTVENDGVPDEESGGRSAGQADGGSGPGVEPGRGSGLAGLRERLTEVDGVLSAGPAGGGLFRVTADVPLPTAVADPPRAAAGDPAPAPGAPLPSPVPHHVSEVTQ